MFLLLFVLRRDEFDSRLLVRCRVLFDPRTLSIFLLYKVTKLVCCNTTTMAERVDRASLVESRSHRLSQGGEIVCCSLFDCIGQRHTEIIHFSLCGSVPMQVPFVSQNSLTRQLPDATLQQKTCVLIILRKRCRPYTHACWLTCHI